MNKLEVSLLVDAIRTRIRIPASYISTHPFYKVLVHPDKDVVIIRLQRDEDTDSRPAPKSGSYLISIHGAIKLLYRCPPTSNQTLALQMVNHGSDIDLIYHVNGLTRLRKDESYYLVSDIIGRY